MEGIVAMSAKRAILKPKKVILDSKGKPSEVVMSIKDYNAMLAEIEELESIRAFDKAKKANDDVIPFEDAVKEIEDKRK
jgi:PHD/YefM family antitoxin component YafN of YafNO toxin-antitoxin module